MTPHRPTLPDTRAPHRSRTSTPAPRRGRAAPLGYGPNRIGARTPRRYRRRPPAPCQTSRRIAARRRHRRAPTSHEAEASPAISSHRQGARLPCWKALPPSPWAQSTLPRRRAGARRGGRRRGACRRAARESGTPSSPPGPPDRWVGNGRLPSAPASQRKFLRASTQAARRHRRDTHRRYTRERREARARPLPPRSVFARSRAPSRRAWRDGDPPPPRQRPQKA